jgi:hypothetical protein
MRWKVFGDGAVRETADGLEERISNLEAAIKRLEAGAKDRDPCVKDARAPKFIDWTKQVSDLEAAAYLSSIRYLDVGVNVGDLVAGWGFGTQEFEGSWRTSFKRVRLSDVVLAILKHLGGDVVIQPATSEAVTVKWPEPPKPKK